MLYRCSRFPLSLHRLPYRSRVHPCIARHGVRGLRLTCKARRQAIRKETGSTSAMKEDIRYIDAGPSSLFVCLPATYMYPSVPTTPTTAETACEMIHDVLSFHMDTLTGLEQRQRGVWDGQNCFVDGKAKFGWEMEEVEC